MALYSPSRFTLYGSQLVDQHIQRDLRLITQYLHERWPEQQLAALVLSGSYGRGEGGVQRKNSREYPCDDYDLLVIFKQLRPAERLTINQRLQRAAQALSAKTACTVDLAPACDLRALHDAPRTLFWYALRHSHKVIWGNPEILQQLPEFPAAEVPPEETFKLLLNRGVELWQAIEAGFPLVDPWKDPRWSPLLLAIYNAIIAIGDSLLILAHCYHSSYQERVQILKSYLQQEPHLPEAPMLAYLYPEAVQYRLSPSDYRNLPVELMIGKLEVVRKIFLEYFFHGLQRFYHSPALNCDNYPQWVIGLRTHPPHWRQSLANLCQNRDWFKPWQLWSGWNLHPPHLRFLLCLPYLLAPNSLSPGPELAGVFPGCERIPTLEQLKQGFSHYRMVR